MRPEIVVIGAGGHAKVVVATAQAAGIDVRALFDDDPEVWGSCVLGVPVEGPSEAAALVGLPALLAIGCSRTRRDLAERMDLSWFVLVHPQAVVHPSVAVGPGTVVFAGAVIQPGVRIGAHAIINTSASVDHDCNLGDFVHVGPGCRLAGEVKIEEGVFLGIGSCLIPQVRVGRWSVVGAGAAVVKDIPANVVAAGVPARILRSNPEVSL